MKPCKPVYEHIDQEEFGDGKKITTSLLERYCKNISGLWKKTGELEDNTDPELRKTFTPPIIHDMHSYGTRLNASNGYEFDNSTETIFIDAIGLKTIELHDLKEIENGKTRLYTKELETAHNIIKISINKQENEYDPKNSLEELETGQHGYYLDLEKNILYIKPALTETPTKVLATVYSDDPYIDRKNTTAHVDLAKNVIHAPYSPDQYEEEVIDQNTAEQYTMDATGKVTSTIRNVEKYWNFGWRKFNHFWMYPLWLQDPFAESPNTPPIPTVARAFIITPRNTGILTKIRLMFNVKNGAEDEVYVEIRTLTPEGKPSTKILAREKTRIRGAKQSLLHTINFSTPPLLTKSEKYAVVVRAGFTSPDKSYGLGGWSYATYPGEVIKNLTKKAVNKISGDLPGPWKHIFDFDNDILSDVLVSIDNCVSWTKVHPVLEGILDGMGARAFSYQTFIKPLKSAATLTKKQSMVYWKPIKTNPIQSVQLTPSTQGDYVKWEISTNMIDWHQIKHPEWSYNFQEDGERHEKNQNQLYIRATINASEKSIKGSSEINGLKVMIKTLPADTAYLKTLFYNPRLGNLLGASLWSSLGTNVTLNPPLSDKIDVKVDVIRNKIMKDTIESNGKTMTFPLSEKPSKPLVKVTILPSTLYLPQTEEQTTIPPTAPATPTEASTEISTENKQKLERLQTILQEIDRIYNEIKSKKTETSQENMQKLAAHFSNVNGIIQNLNDNAKSISLLKESVTPLKSLDGCDKGDCLLNYITILRNIILNTSRLLTNPTSKYINIVPSIPGREGGMTLELTENRDYTVNYKEGTLTLIDAWGVGTIKVEYYPLWLQGLPLKDFPFRTDFIKETFTDTQTLILKAVPLDPVRSVEQYNNDKNEWTELTEAQDYTVNYTKKEIQIHKNEGEKEYRVKYTPYLTDEGLALAYQMKRADMNAQAIIKSCYFQNRV